MDLRRIGFVSLWVLCVVSSVAAAPMDVAVLFDSDDNQFTGCAVSGMQGVDHVFTTNFDTASPAHVTGIFGQRCSDGALSVPVMVDAGGWPALWNETTGELSLETRFPIDFFQPRPGARMRVGIVAHSGSNAAILLLQDDGGPIILPGTPPKRRAVTTPGRAISPDGSAADWSGMIPLAIGDAGSPALRLVEIYGFTAGPNIFFRFVAQASSNAPTAVDDQYSTTPGTPLAVATPGILANDTDPRSLPLSAALVDDVDHGTLVLNSDGSFSYTDGGTAQRDHFTYRASNGEQQSNIARVEIGIGAQPNRPPVTGDDAYQVPLGGTLTVIPPGVLGNDSDPDLDPLQAILQTGPAAGTVTLNANGSFTYVHGGASSAPDSFTYHATDGVENSRETTVHINIQANQPPTATDDAYVVSEGGVLAIAAPGVLTNDTDPDSGSLTTSAVSQPAHGTLTMGTDGSFSYVHDGSETTTDEFTYQISDGAATAVAIVRFTILPADDAPVATNDSYTVAEDGTLSVPAPGVLGNDTDIDSAVSQAILASSTTNGALTLNANGSFTYTPNANFFGTDTFTYRAGDGTNTSANVATVTITVTAVNDAPSFTAGANVTVLEDSAAYNAAWASAISAGPANESAQTLTFVATNDNNALFSVQPSIAPDGTLTFTPAANANGFATVTVTMSDNGAPVLTTAPVMFTITVTAVNDMPSFVKGTDVTVLDTAGPQTVNPWATSLNAGPADEAGQTFTFTVTNVQDASLFSVQPAVSPTGVLTFTPAVGMSGVSTVTLFIQDNGGTANGGVDSSATQTFVITIDKIPAITSPAATTFVAGQPNTFTVTTTGQPKPSITQGGTLPAGVTFVDGTGATKGTGVLSGTPAPLTGGVYPITFQATNPHGSSPVQNFTLTVNEAPAITSANTATFTRGTAGTFTVTTTGFPAPGLSLSAAPPAGLTFTDNGNGTATIAGTPTAAGGSYGGFVITASNGVGTNATQNFTIIINEAPAITSANSTGFTAGVSANFTVTTTGFPAPALSLTGALPTGITFTDNGNGTATLGGNALQGTGGVYTVTITAANAAGSTPQTFTITVCNQISVISPANATGAAGSPFSETFTQTDAVGAATFTLASGTLPAGMTLAANGVLSGTPTQNGTFPITVLVTDSNGCTGTGPTYNLVITCQVITVTNPANANGTANAAFSETFTQTNAIGTATFTLASGTLPAGLTLASNGVLSGTPTQTGSFPITVTVTDSNGCTGTSPTYTIVIACQTITVTNPANTNGTANSPFSETFTQTGAIGTATFTTASTLPTGLTLATNGVLSGTPLQTGSFPIVVTVTDANGCTGTSATYTLVIACQVITVSNPANTNGTAAAAFSETFTQSNAIGSATFTTASTLPAGLTLAASGVLSGTPTQTGTFPIVVTVTDANGCTGTSGTYNLTIGCQTITVTNPVNTSGTVSSGFSETFTQSGAIGTATFTLASGVLPAGLTLATDGTLAGVPTQPGSFPITVTVTDANGCTGTSATYTLVIACQTITVTNPANATGPAGSPFSETFTESGAIGSATFTTASTLPTGLTLASNGVLSGTPTQGGTFPIVVTVTDSNGCTGTSATYNLVITCPVITVTNPANANGTAGSAFSETFTQTGAIGTATFTLASGTLPAGLTLASNGVLSGTPTQTGSFPISVMVTDSNGCTGTGSTYTIVIACQTITVTNPANGNGTANSAFSETFTETGAIGTATFTLASGTLPAGLTLATNGVLSGTPTQTGTFPITVTVTDSNGCTGTSATYTITIGCQTITVTNPANANGTAGSPFSETFTQTNAIGTATFTLASGTLPAGLTLAANGVLSGTPTQTGSFPITVTVTDSNGCTGTSATYNLTIACQTITVTNPASATGTVNAAFSETFTQSGAIGSATFTTASTLPTGLSLAANGVLSGTPSQSGTFPIVVTVTDANGCTGTSATYNLVIACQTITVTNPAVDTGTAGVSFTQQFTQSGAIGTATFTTASALPAGLVLQSDGTLTGTPTGAGSFPIVVTVTDSNGCTGTSATYNLTIACQTLSITNPATTSVQAGAPLSATFTATGILGTATWSLETGSLPAGITLNASTGELSGSTTQQGSYPITVRVTDTNGCFAISGTYTLDVTCPVITVTRTGGGSFPSGTFNVAYAGQSVTASGGTAPYTFSVSGGTFPTGLTLNGDGTITGTPTQTGTFNFTIQAQDAAFCPGTQSFSIAINPFAAAESYSNLVNNTQAVVTGGTTSSPTSPFVALTGTITANDLPAGGVAVTAGTFATTQGGSVTIAADGTFAYTPPITVNALASDTFTYTIASDTAGTGTPTAANGTVTLNLAGRVWYVKNNAAAGGNGQSQSPFNSLAGFSTTPRSGPDKPGDIIFVYSGDGTTTNHTTGIILLDNEQLIGEAVALVVAGNTLVPAGASPVITRAGSNVVALANSNTVRGITATGGTTGIDANTITNFTGDTLVVTNNTFNGLSVGNSAGTFTVTNSSFSGNATAGIAAVSVNFGTAAVSLDSTNTIDAPAGMGAASVSNHSSGAVQIGANITGGGTLSVVNNTGSGTITFGGAPPFNGSIALNAANQNAVFISGNSAGTTINFAAPMTITNTTGAAFLASGAGTLSVTGAVTATTTGAANDIISINGTGGLIFGGGGVTFASVNNSGFGVVRALRLTSLNGLVTVNGGTMTNGQTAVELQGPTTSLTLNDVTINGTYGFGIRNPAATNFGTLTLSNTSIGAGTAVNLNNGTLIASGSTLNGAGEGILLDTVVIGAGGATFVTTNANGGAFGASLTNVTGQPLNLGTGQLIHNSNTNFLVSGGTAAISYAGNLFNNAARFLVDINGHTVGAITLSGELGIAASPNNVAGTGIRVQNSSGTLTFSGTKTLGAATGRMASPAVQLLNNTGATFNFSGTTAIFTAGFTAFTADAGTINFGGTNSINSQGSALVLSNVALGAGTFSNVTSTGGVNGISLTTVTGGPLTISGGALSGATGATFLVSGGTAGVSYAGSITHGAAAQPAVGITNHTTGTIGFSGSISTTNGTGLQFNNADGVYPFSGTATINGGTAGVSINTGSAGTFTFASGTQIGNSTSPSGVAFDINNAGATTNVTYNGTINTTLNRPVSVQNVGASSTISFTGNVTSTNNGILLASMGNPTSVTFSGTSKSLSVGANTAVSMTGVAGNTVTFSNGGLVITRTTGAGVVATGGGTLIITRNAGTANTIGNGTSGTGLSLTNVTIGSGGLVFESISQNGGANGIFLQNTGATAGLTIAGTGAAGSGGTIQNTTGADGATAGSGIYLDNTRSVSLTSMQLNGHSNFAIRGNLVVGFTLTNSTINGTNGSSAATDDSSIRFTDLTGTASITGCNISGGHEDNLAVVNNSGTLDRITVNNTTFGANSTLEGNDALFLQADGTATIKATVTNSFFTSSRGDLFQFSVRSNGANDLIFQSNALSNNHSNIVSGGGGFTITSANTPVLTYNISNNTFRDAVGSNLVVGMDGTNGSFTGTVNANTVGVAGGVQAGSAQGHGMVFGGFLNGGTHAVTITNNNVYDYTNNGIYVVAGEGGTGQGRLNVTIQGNTVAEPTGFGGFVFNGIRVLYGTTSGPPAHAFKGCVTFGGAGALRNTVVGSSGAAGIPEIRLFPRFQAQVGVIGFTPTGSTAADGPAMAAFLQANNIVTAGEANGNNSSTNPYLGTCPP